MSESRSSYIVNYADKRSVCRAIEGELIRLSKTDARNYTGPDPTLVRAVIDSSNMSQSEIADMLRVNVSTIRRWISCSDLKQSREMPYAAWCILLCCCEHMNVRKLLSISKQ